MGDHADDAIEQSMWGIDTDCGEEEPHIGPFSMLYDRVRPSKKQIQDAWRKKFNNPDMMPRNHGLPWSTEDEQRACFQFFASKPYTIIGKELERTANAVYLKLVELGITDDDESCSEFDSFMEGADYSNLELRVVAQINQQADKEEHKMKSDQIAAVLMDGVKTIGVSFGKSGPQIYTYKTLEDHEEGDRVVVDGAGQLKVAYVREIHEVAQIDIDSDFDYKWVVQKVNLTKHEEIIAKEEEFAQELLKMQHQSVRDNVKHRLLTGIGVKTEALDNAIGKLNKKL